MIKKTVYGLLENPHVIRKIPRIRNDFKWDVSDEVIYIAYARILEQEAMQLMTGGETGVAINADVARYFT